MQTAALGDIDQIRLNGTPGHLIGPVQPDSVSLTPAQKAGPHTDKRSFRGLDVALARLGTVEGQT